MKVGDLVRYKTGEFWSVDDLFVVLRVTNHKKTWHRKIWLYSPRIKPCFIDINWDDRFMMEVISEIR